MSFSPEDTDAAYCVINILTDDEANPTVDDYYGFTINNGIENASMNLALGSSYPVTKDQSRVPSVEVAGQPTMTPASTPLTPVGTPSGFMSPEVKRATQYGTDTLYSPKALDNLYSDINAYDISDIDRRIAAQQALLGQTIDASQYGGVVGAEYNPKIKTPTSIENAVDDPFNDDVTMHWTGNKYNPRNVGPEGFGYSVTIDDEGNINYNRNFNPDGTMVGTNHIAGQNPQYIGISSQGNEPNSLQRDAAAALGGNWFNKSASVTTHGYEDGTRYDTGDRPASEAIRADGTRADKDRREGTALAASFADVEDPGENWSPVSLADSRPASSYKSYSPVSGLATIAEQTPPTSRSMTPASSYTYDGSYGPQRDQRYYSTPSRGSVPDDSFYDGMTLDEAYRGTGPARNRGTPGRGNVNLGGLVTQDKPSFAPLDNRMTSAEGFDPTGIYGPHLTVAQYPAEDIYGEPVQNQSSRNQSTSTVLKSAPTEIDVNGALHVADAPDGYNPLGSLSPKYYGPANQPSFDDFYAEGQPEFDQDRLHVVGGGGFPAFNTPLGVAGPDTDVGTRLSPERRDRFYNGPPPDELVSAGEPPPAAGPQHPIYGGPIGDIEFPEKPKAYKLGQSIASATGPFGAAASAMLTGMDKFQRYKWGKMSAEERLALIDKWNRQNADYIRNRTDGRGGKAELTDRLFANSSSGSGAARGTRRSNDDGSDAIPPPVVNDLAREYLGPTDPYNYGFGPEYTYYGS